MSPGQLNNRNSAELLANGHILIADENNNRAIEVTHDTSAIIVKVGIFTAGSTVSGCAFASRLANGNSLLTDSNNSRIVEVDSKDKVLAHGCRQVATEALSRLGTLDSRAVQDASRNDG